MNRARFKCSVINDGRFKAAWGIHVIGGFTPEDDFMAFAFRIGIKGCDNKVWMKGATHQISIHPIDPETKIDFKKPMFEQKGLCMSSIPCIAWQGKYASDEDCVTKVSADVQHICSLDVKPYYESEEEWVRNINHHRKNPVPYKILPRATFMKKGKV